MMKNSKIILSGLICIMLAASASAVWVPLTGNPVSINSLQGGSLIFGDKKLSDVSLFGIGAGGAIAPDANSVFVQGGQDSVTGNYGLWFLLSWNAFSGQTINATLNFSISVLPGYDDKYIKDVEMDITGASATGSGGVAVGETVWDAPFPGGNVIASLSCAKQPNDGGADLVDHAEFAPTKEIWIWSKDISITGGTGTIPYGSGHLSGLFQFYSQTPEPATFALLGLGTLGLLRRKRKTWRNDGLRYDCMLKKTFISTLLIVVCCLSAGTNVGLAAPVSSLGDWNEGDQGTTHQVWDFTPANVVYGVGYTAIPESVISPDTGAVVATISPAGSYNSDTDSFVARNYLLVSLEIPNYDVLNPYKVIWVDIGDAAINPDDIAVSAIGNGIPSTSYVCELLPGQGDAEFGVIIRPNPEVEKLTMFFGPGAVLDYIHVDTICIPEPVTLAFLGLGTLSLLRRKRKA